jgi:hypothetical protein
MTTTKVERKHLPRGQSKNCLSQKAWAAYLAAHIRKTAEEGAWILNGVRLSESDSRSYYRWKHEGNKPTIWSADHFLVRHRVHLDAYFTWCELNGLDAWEFGEPAWHREDISA